MYVLLYYVLRVIGYSESASVAIFPTYRRNNETIRDRSGCPATTCQRIAASGARRSKLSVPDKST